MLTNQKMRTWRIGMLLFFAVVCGVGGAVISSANLDQSRPGSMQQWIYTAITGCATTEVWKGWSGSILSPSLKCQSKDEVLEAVLSGARVEIRSTSCGSGSGFITGFESDGRPICRTP